MYCESKKRCVAGMFAAALLIVLVIVLTACAPITAQLDETTGTTLAERCESRRAAVAVYDARATELSETEMRIRMDYQLFIDTVCPPLPAGP